MPEIPLRLTADAGFSGDGGHTQNRGGLCGLGKDTCIAGIGPCTGLAMDSGNGPLLGRLGRERARSRGVGVESFRSSLHHSPLFILFSWDNDIHDALFFNSIV